MPASSAVCQRGREPAHETKMLKGNLALQAFQGGNSAASL